MGPKMLSLVSIASEKVDQVIIDGPPVMGLADAPFWNRAQASFLRESLKQDAEWCEIIDELNTLLH